MNILKTAAASRAARLTAIAGLLGAGLIGLSSSAEGATTPTLTLSTSTGSSSGGDLLTVKGKGFMDDAFSSQVLGWDFTSAPCTSTVSTDATTSASGLGTTSLGVLNVTSATTATVKTPSNMTAGTWYLCFWDASSGTTANIIGQAKFVTAAPPTVTYVNIIGDAGGNGVSASALGGTLVTVEGANFTKKTLVSIDGVAATKTTVVSTDSVRGKVTAVLPSHLSGGTTYALKVTTEYGSVSGASPVTYVGVVSVSPNLGKKTTSTSIQLTGIGFNTYAATGTNLVGFVNTPSLVGTDISYVVAFAPGSAGLAGSGGAVTNVTGYCTDILIISDTSLSCKTPSTLNGAYSVQILKTTAGTGVATITTLITNVARAATYTAANY
jgi:hypothetical protein